MGMLLEKLHPNSKLKPDLTLLPVETFPKKHSLERKVITVLTRNCMTWKNSGRVRAVINMNGKLNIALQTSLSHDPCSVP